LRHRPGSSPYSSAKEYEARQVSAGGC